MATIDKITLPDGSSYDIKDNISGYSTLQNLVDGSATGSLRSVGTYSESSSYTIGQYAFAEGYNTKASGGAAHAEGGNTIAQGDDSHAEGGSTTASGDGSHAEGISTTASGNFSHAANNHTIAQRLSQTVIGEYNWEDYGGTPALTSELSTTHGEYAFIIGNGDSSSRSNAFAVDWEGGVRTYEKNIDITTTPSADQWGNGILMYSRNGAEFGGIQSAYLTTDARRTYLLQRDSTGTTSCNISVGFDGSNNPKYTFSNPAIFIKDLGAFPVGSVYITSTNSNPGPYLGGTWTLFDKEFSQAWITNGVTWNTTATQAAQDFLAFRRGQSIEFRFRWANKIAISGTDRTIATINLATIGVSALHDSYPVVISDGLNAIGICRLSSTGVLDAWNWVTRAASYPTTTGSNIQASCVQNVAFEYMLDAACDKFYWKRTA